MLLDAVRALPVEKRIELCWKTLVEDGACRGCGICEDMYPHGALSLTDAALGDSSLAEGELGKEPFMPRYLAHDASRCTQCGLCYMSCPQQNLGGWDDMRSSDVLAVKYNPIDVSACEKCGRLFKAEPGRTKCPACSHFRFGLR